MRQLSLLIFLLCCMIAACSKSDSKTEEPSQTMHIPSLYAREQNNAAVQALQIGNFKVAFAKINEAIKEDPLFAAPYYNRALLEIINKRYVAAQDSLLKCTELDPKHAEAQLLLGILLERSKKISEAQAAFFLARDSYQELAQPTQQDDVFHAIAVYLGEGVAPGLEAVNILLAKYPDYPLAQDLQKRLRAGERDFILEWLIAQKSKFKNIKGTAASVKKVGKKGQKNKDAQSRTKGDTDGS